MKVGSVLKNVVVIQSDDRENGLEDLTPIIPIGTTGVMIGMSKDSLEEDHVLKNGCSDCIVVRFDLPNGDNWNFDVHPDEVVAV